MKLVAAHRGHYDHSVGHICTTNGEEKYEEVETNNPAYMYIDLVDMERPWLNRGAFEIYKEPNYIFSEAMYNKLFNNKILNKLLTLHKVAHG